MTSLASESFDALNTSNLDSDYADNDSLDDASFDGMSFVSNSEIHDLEEDLRNFNDDGYDTETTDNTSPSHKFSQPTTRKASSIARIRIKAKLDSHESYSPAVEANSDQPSHAKRPQDHTFPYTDKPPNTVSPTSPHPSFNTNSSHEGSGASAT
jgi:hypothetical protein